MVKVRSHKLSFERISSVDYTIMSSMKSPSLGKKVIAKVKMSVFRQRSQSRSHDHSPWCHLNEFHWQSMLDLTVWNLDPTCFESNSQGSRLTNAIPRHIKSFSFNLKPRRLTTIAWIRWQNDFWHKYAKNVRKNGRDLTQSYDKSPYSNKKFKKAKWQHKNNNQKFRLHNNWRPAYDCHLEFIQPPNWCG